MDALIFGAVLVALAAFVAAPLYRSPQGPLRHGERNDLAARKEVLVAQLREIDADLASGLLGPEEYERQRAAAEAEAAEVFRRLSVPGD